MLLHGDAADVGGAGGRMDLAEDHAEGRALAGAVVAEEAEDLAPGNFEGELVKGRPRAEVFERRSSRIIERW